MAPAPQPVFYYDLGSPACYLAAEQINSALPLVPEWEPVPAAVATPVPRHAEVDADVGGGGGVDVEELARRAAELELQPLRWPRHWPPDTRQAMLMATYAKRVGRAVAFSLAAFRQAFAAGRDLGDTDTLLIAAAACEMHPTAVLKGIALRSVTEALNGAADRARAAGVQSLPAIQVDSRVYQGEDLISGAARALEEFG